MKTKDLVNLLVNADPDGDDEIIVMDLIASTTYDVDSVINQLGETYVMIEEK